MDGTGSTWSRLPANPTRGVKSVGLDPNRAERAEAGLEGPPTPARDSGRQVRSCIEHTGTTRTLRGLVKTVTVEL